MNINKAHRDFLNLPVSQKILYSFVTLLGMYGCILALYHFSYYMDYLTVSKYYIPDSTWVEVTGTYSRHSLAPRGTECTFDYIFNGKNYDQLHGGNDINQYYAFIGDKFTLKVNPTAPDRYIIVKYKPVFLPGEMTSFVTGTVLSVDKLKGGFNIFLNYHKPLYGPFANYAVGFYYIVGNTRYDKGQYLSPYLDSLNKKINSGDKFQVEYLIDNPARAIIHVNQSISQE